MTYDERLQHVSVLGAAGKMGSGILLLTALEMADLSLKKENKEKAFSLYAIDVSPEALKGLMGYMKAQVFKMAEKKMVQLRSFYADRPDLIENSEIVDTYTAHVLSLIKPVTRIENAYDSTLVFEAIREDPVLKVRIFSQINQNNPDKPWFLTNTSSIPIGELDEKAGLEGRILGFHFYNPPAVQKLVELIKSEQTHREIEEFALTYAKNLRKTIVPSKDVAGFIGNGHFMRDLLYGIREAEKLGKDYGMAKAIWMVNKVSQDYLVRPMGIFQLIDYVGLDVCQYILSVMNSYMKEEDLHSNFLDDVIRQGVKGGQFADGSHKDGFLKYEKNRPVGVYDPSTKAYKAINDIQSPGADILGKPPLPFPQWKNAVRATDKDAIFRPWFSALKNDGTPGSVMAVNYAVNSMQIGQRLVSSGVAASANDVNTVLLTGFFHAYGPINDYL